MSHVKRRKKFVDGPVQGTLVRRIIVHWLVFLLVASIVTFMLQVLTDPFRPISDHLQDLWYTQGPFLLVMVFLLPVFVIDTVKLSHRFAGPIVGLRRAMQEIAAGKPPRKLKFRQGDFWHEVADDYNAMLGTLAPNAKNAERTEDTNEPVTAER